MKKYKNIKGLLTGTALASLAVAQPASALDNDLSLYLWGSSISGTATLMDQSRTLVEADFDELVDKLEMAFQIHYEGVGDRWGVGLDYSYISLGDTNDAGITTDVDNKIGEAFAIYRANDTLDLFGGVRFTEMEMELATQGTVLNSGDRSLTDFFVGGRVQVPFSSNWRGALRADVGAGDSDSVWNIAALVDWQVSNSVALRGGYRWLTYTIDRDAANLDAEMDVSYDGPFLAIGFQW